MIYKIFLLLHENPLVAFFGYFVHTLTSEYVLPMSRLFCIFQINPWVDMDQQVKVDRIVYSY